MFFRQNNLFSPIIYIRCNAYTQTNTRRTLQAREMGTPPARSKQLHALSNHARTASQRTTPTASGRAMGRTLAPSGMPHTMSNHTQNETQGAHPRPLQGERWARPRPVWYASRPEPCALGAQPGHLAPLCPGHIAP